MRMLTGIALTVAGLGSAAYLGIATENEQAAADRLAALVKIAAESSRPAQRQSEPRQEQKAEAVVNVAAPKVHRQDAGPVTPLPPPGPVAAMPDAPPAVLAQAPATGMARSTETTPVQRPLGTVKPKDDSARRELARSIQAELKRVGCLEGDLDGVWNSNTKRAMKSFTERVNASLPTEEPDYILLTLLQGHTAKACGKECPAGQVVANDGRCQPRAIVTAANREAVPRRPKSEPGVAANAVTTAAPRVEGPRSTADDTSVLEAQRNQQLALEQRRLRLEAERQARVKAADEAQQKLALHEQQKADAEKLRQARLEIEQQIKAKAAEEARRKQAELDQQQAEAKAEAERQRVAKLEADRLAKEQVERDRAARREAERLAKAQAAEEARQQQAELDRQKAEAKAEAERQRTAKLEADRLAKEQAERDRVAKREAERLAKAQAAEEARRKQAELERQKAVVRAEAERMRLAAMASLDQLRSSASGAEGSQAERSIDPAPPADSAATDTSAAALPANSGTVAAEPGSSPAVASASAQQPKPKAQAAAKPAKPKSATAPTKKKPTQVAAAREENSDAETLQRIVGQRPEPLLFAPSPPRFVQRFVPPPPSYVGRLYVPRPVAIPAVPVAGPARTTLFHNLSRSAP